jgi:hypothetical protein
MGTRGRIFAGLAVLGVVAGTALAVRLGVGPLPDPEGCTAKVGGRTVRLDTEQSENASLIAAIGVQRGLPARAASIALATAYQESKITNIEHGDRDSIGLFQQRPSHGWGTVEQILDPVYAINAFYDALVKIDGYETMRITEAAQKVQRSGFPEAYEDHAADARALASALSGNSVDGKFTCVVRHSAGQESDARDKSGLTARAAIVRDDVEAAFGNLTMGGSLPDGRAIDVFVRPRNKANNRKGWAIAYYLVAQADRLSIDHLIFDDMIWTSGRLSENGWRNYDPGSASGRRAVLEHRDHVHVDVLD